MALTWQQKIDNWPKSETKVIQKGFGGIPAGATILIPCPSEIQSYLSALPSGVFHTAQQMSDALAVKYGVAGTCPVTRGLCLRIVGEKALEDLAAGAKLEDIPPFWRVVEPKAPLAAKLTCGPEWIRARRDSEAALV